MELVSGDVTDDTDCHPVHGERWRWRIDVPPIITLPLEDAPTLTDAGIDPRRGRRQSPILLTHTEGRNPDGRRPRPRTWSAQRSSDRAARPRRQEIADAVELIGHRTSRVKRHLDI
jgi:hypothetical protein